MEHTFEQGESDRSVVPGTAAEQAPRARTSAVASEPFEPWVVGGFLRQHGVLINADRSIPVRRRASSVLSQCPKLGEQDPSGERARQHRRHAKRDDGDGDGED